jgi:EAL domain-containing protein (putative c-di-GMP-specific phosphodiesterase class I)
MQTWMKRFPNHARFVVNVNISTKHFIQSGLVEYVQQVLHETSLEPGILKLEITEDMILTSVDLAIETLSYLRALGIGICLDDFGTGYSSLSYLNTLPVTALKVDRSFVGRLDSDEQNLNVVKTIVTLAHTLGMEVVAEGIESIEHVIRLKELGCEYGQGFLFSHPLCPRDAEEWLKRGQNHNNGVQQYSIFKDNSHTLPLQYSV